MLSVLLDLPMPNTKMEAGQRKNNLQNASQAQLEMFGMREINNEMKILSFDTLKV